MNNYVYNIVVLHDNKYLYIARHAKARRYQENFGNTNKSIRKQNETEYCIFNIIK